MTLTVRYHAQLRSLAGVAVEAVALTDGATTEALLRALIERRPGLAAHLVTESGAKRPSLLLFVNDRDADAGQVLRPGDEVILMTPIAGGTA